MLLCCCSCRCWRRLLLTLTGLLYMLLGMVLLLWLVRLRMVCLHLLPRMLLPLRPLLFRGGRHWLPLQGLGSNMLLLLLLQLAVLHGLLQVVLLQTWLSLLLRQRPLLLRRLLMQRMCWA